MYCSEAVAISRPFLFCWPSEKITAAEKRPPKIFIAQVSTSFLIALRIYLIKLSNNKNKEPPPTRMEKTLRGIIVCWGLCNRVAAERPLCVGQ